MKSSVFKTTSVWLFGQQQSSDFLNLGVKLYLKVSLISRFKEMQQLDLWLQPFKQSTCFLGQPALYESFQWFCVPWILCIRLKKQLYPLLAPNSKEEELQCSSSFVDFRNTVDLVRFIRRNFANYFTICVAGMPIYCIYCRYACNFKFLPSFLQILNKFSTLQMRYIFQEIVPVLKMVGCRENLSYQTNKTFWRGRVGRICRVKSSENENPESEGIQMLCLWIEAILGHCIFVMQISRPKNL